MNECSIAGHVLLLALAWGIMVGIPATMLAIGIGIAIRISDGPVEESKT